MENLDNVSKVNYGVNVAVRGQERPMLGFYEAIVRRVGSIVEYDFSEHPRFREKGFFKNRQIERKKRYLFTLFFTEIGCTDNQYTLY